MRERWWKFKVCVCFYDTSCSLFKLTKQYLSRHMKQNNPSEKLFSEQICGAPAFYCCISEVLLLGLCSLSASKLSFSPIGPWAELSSANHSWLLTISWCSCSHNSTGLPSVWMVLQEIKGYWKNDLSFHQGVFFRYRPSVTFLPLFL